MTSEKTISSNTVFTGKIITLKVNTVQLPNGKESTREIIKHPGAVAILAITEDGRIPILKQFRSACQEVLIEIPAGKLERGEDILDAAKRELAEETGYEAEQWTKLFSFYTSPGFADEVIHLFVAEKLTLGEQMLDEDEFLEVEYLDQHQASELLAEGKIRDAKTVCALLWWLHHPKGR